MDRKRKQREKEYLCTTNLCKCTVWDGRGDKKSNETTFGIVLYPFCFFFQCTWLVRKKPLSFLLFFYLFLFLQVGNEESISSSSCIRMIIYVLLYKKKDYLRILFCSLTGKIRSTPPDRAAWRIEGCKVKNELRSFIYLKMIFFKTNLNIA